MIRQLLGFVRSLRHPLCPYQCGQHVPTQAVARHWWLDHAGDLEIKP